MANPFKDWTPQMVEDYNRRNKSAIKAADKGMNDRFDITLPSSKFKALPLPTKPRKPLLNKTEARFLKILMADHPGHHIGCQSITFRLGYDLRYTPDFWIAGFGKWPMVFWETKGAFIREKGMIKLKTAAAMFPMFTFILAQWKDGKWTTKTIPAL